MSETKFREAKGELAFSQQLADKMRQDEMAKMNMEEPMEEAPMEAEKIVTEPQEEVQEEESITISVMDKIKPMFEELKSMIMDKKEEPKEVEVKMQGEIVPDKE
jgi:hypothetical protein